ncbi:MAG: hypothetical protein MZV70_72360 [Desulfobacterales bacterium]|nr:hypothetical protein [Desulfobacterales bacterium]
MITPMVTGSSSGIVGPVGSGKASILQGEALRGNADQAVECPDSLRRWSPARFKGLDARVQCSCGRNQSQVPLRKRQIRQSAARCRKRAGRQYSSMDWRITAAWRLPLTRLENDAPDIHRGIKMQAAQNHGRRRPGYLVAVDNQNDRRAEEVWPVRPCCNSPAALTPS